MIFATVGTQLPFDRLLSALDDWASLNTATPVVAQTGATDQRFRRLSATPFLTQQQFASAFERARIIVAHAGMGTILTAAELGKPVIIMPRLARLGEHRNDHQVATAAEMSQLDNVAVVETPSELSSAIDAAMHAPEFASIASATASDELLHAVRSFIAGASDARTVSQPGQLTQTAGLA